MSLARSLDQIARGAGAQDALDLAKIEEVEGMLGEATVAQMLERLARDVGERLSDARLAAGRDDVAADAHACVSSTGFLGFSALSGACAALERACRQNLARADQTAAVVHERDRGLALLRSLHDHRAGR